MKRLMMLLYVSLLLLNVLQNKAAGQETSAPKPTQHYFVKISVSQCHLWLYKQNNKGLSLVSEHKVGTAKRGLKKFPLGSGYITAIDFSPVWHPTAYTRWFFARKGINLPSTIPFGHPLNYMGAFRISLSHNVPGKGSVYRIHGVRPGDEKCVGTRVSGGCIRMLNKEGLEFARTVSVGTPVEIVL